MTAEYRPTEFWQEVGRQPPPDTATDVFREQEHRLLATLEGLEFKSVLEVGCGFGRITRLVSERWPDATYTAIDLSAERLAAAREKAPSVEFIQTTIQGFKSRRKWDLVLAVEMLMHVPEAEVADVVERLCGLSRRHVVSVDWAVPLGSTPIAAHNALFDYPALYGTRLRSVEQIAYQAIYVADVRP